MAVTQLLIDPILLIAGRRWLKAIREIGEDITRHHATSGVRVMWFYRHSFDDFCQGFL
jgi:hypothetical protein